METANRPEAHLCWSGFISWPRSVRAVRRHWRCIDRRRRMRRHGCALCERLRVCAWRSVHQPPEHNATVIRRAQDPCNRISQDTRPHPQLHYDRGISASPTRAPVSGHLGASRGISGHLGASRRRQPELQSRGISGHLGASRGISGHLGVAIQSVAVIARGTPVATSADRKGSPLRTRTPPPQPRPTWPPRRHDCKHAKMARQYDGLRSQ